jgi:hypothetical protein
MKEHKNITQTHRLSIFSQPPLKKGFLGRIGGGLDLNLDLDHDLNLAPHTFRSELARINPINIHKSSNSEKLKKSKIKIMIKIEIKI